MKKLLFIGFIVIAITLVVFTGDNNNIIKTQTNSTVYVSDIKKDLKTTPKNNVKDNNLKTDNVELIFKIVTKNIDYEVVNDGEIKSDVLLIEDNINKILKTVSTKYYAGELLELTSVETINNKK